jgi:hypothetical protein
MKTFFGLFVLLAIASCSSPQFYAYHLQSLPGSEQGTIYIETTGLGNSEDDAYNNAASEAFNAVLFKGIPGSVQPKPMVDDETAAKNAHKDVIDCFHTFECYSKFVSGSEKIGTPQKVKGGTSVNLRIKINLPLLKTYLEQNNVIRKFGL